MEAISSYIQEEFIKAGAGKVALADKWLASKLLGRLNIPKEEKKSKTPEIFDILEHFIEVHDISDSQRRQYKVLLRALKRFSLYTGESVELDDLTADTLRDFSDFLSTEHEFIGTDDEGTPYIMDRQYQTVYDQVPECRFPKPRGKNSIIGIMSRFRLGGRK